MGNNTSQPSPTTQPNQSSASPRKIIKSKTFKQEIPQQPKIQVTTKVVPKEFHLELQLTQQQQNEIREMKVKIKQQFALRFMSKIHKKQIRLIFSNSQNQDSREMLLITTGLQEKSLERMEKSCRMDLQIYLQIFQTRLKGIITHKLNQQSKVGLENKQNLNRIKSQLVQLFRQGMVTLLGQIQGKTTIWHSLALNRIQLTNNIIRFCHEQGVDSSLFDFLAMKTQL